MMTRGPEDWETIKLVVFSYYYYYYSLRLTCGLGFIESSHQRPACPKQWMIQRNVSIKYNLPTKTVVKRFYKKFYIIASMNWKDGGALSQNKNVWSQRKLMDWNMGGWHCRGFSVEEWEVGGGGSGYGNGGNSSDALLHAVSVFVSANI